MGFDWGYGMMGGFGLYASLLWLVLFIDAILFGIWLWKQINRK